MTRGSALITSIITSAVFLALLFVLFTFSDLLQRQAQRSISQAQILSLGNSGLNRALARWRVDRNYIGEAYDLNTGAVDTFIRPLASNPAARVITARVYVPSRTAVTKQCKVFRVHMDSTTSNLVDKTYEEFDEPDCGASIPPEPSPSVPPGGGGSPTPSSSASPSPGTEDIIAGVAINLEDWNKDIKFQDGFDRTYLAIYKEKNPQPVIITKEADRWEEVGIVPGTLLKANASKAKFIPPSNPNYQLPFWPPATQEERMMKYGYWVVEWRPQDLGSSDATIPTGYYCAQIEFRFKEDSDPYTTAFGKGLKDQYTAFTDSYSDVGFYAGPFEYVRGSGRKIFWSSGSFDSTSNDISYRPGGCPKNPYQVQPFADVLP